MECVKLYQAHANAIKASSERHAKTENVKIIVLIMEFAIMETVYVIMDGLHPIAPKKYVLMNALEKVFVIMDIVSVDLDLKELIVLNNQNQMNL
jgi:hypothetical protein